MRIGIYFNTLAQQKNFTRQISECPCSSNKTFILRLMYCALFFSQRILARNHSYFFCSKSSSQSRTKGTSDRSGLSAQSSLSIFPQKYLHKLEDAYFILQNIWLFFKVKCAAQGKNHQICLQKKLGENKEKPWSMCIQPSFWGYPKILFVVIDPSPAQKRLYFNLQR